MVLPGLGQRPLSIATVGLTGVLAAVGLCLVGCGKKVDLQHQTAELEAAFPGLAAAAPARQDQPAAEAEAKAWVSAALAALRTNDFVTAVVMLQKASQSPGITAEQFMAVQAARRAWVQDLVTRAGRGDPSAKAALVAIEEAH